MGKIGYIIYEISLYARINIYLISGMETVERVINMRIIQPDKLEKLWNEVEPYLILSLNGSSFKEGTPEEIKEKFKEREKLYSELTDSCSVI